MTSTQHRPRLNPWLIFAIIVTSLFAPLATTAAPPDDIPNETKVCPQGESWNEQTNQCEPTPTPDLAIPLQPSDCPEGQALDE